MLRQGLSLLLSLSIGASASAAWAQSEPPARVSLDEAREILRERNPNVLAGRASTDQTRLLDAQARTLLRPTVEASATYTLRDREISFDSPNIYAPLGPYLQVVRDELAPNDPRLIDPELLAGSPGTSAVIQFRHDVRGTLTATQSLFNARAFSLIEQAGITIRQAANGVDQTVYQLEGALIQAFFGAVGLQRFVAIAERQLELATLTWERARSSHEAGVGNLFEVNRAQVEVAAAERDVENARASYRMAVRDIAGLLNLDTLDDIIEPPALDPDTDLDAMLEGVARRRPDLLGFELAAEFAEEGLREKRLQWLPVFGAQAAASLQRANAFAGERFVWTLSVFANWTLYDGGMIRTERNSRELDIVISEHRRDAALVQLRADFARMRGEIDQARNNVRLARAQTELAERNVWLTEQALELGAASSLDAQFALQQLYLSQLALAEAEVSLQSALYQLRHVAAADWAG